MDTQPRQEPTANECTHDPDKQVAKHSETAASHDLACQPACNDAYE